MCILGTPCVINKALFKFFNEIQKKYMEQCQMYNKCSIAAAADDDDDDEENPLNNWWHSPLNNASLSAFSYTHS